MNLKKMKSSANKLMCQLESVLTIVGCGINLDGITIFIYESQHNYLSLIPTFFDGFKVSYEFTDYPQLA